MMTAILFLVIFGIEMRFLAASGYRELLLGNVIRVLLINDLLFPLTGVVLGMCLAVATKRRWSGYIWLLAIMLLGCGLLHRISMGLFMTVGWNLDSVYHMFQFGQPNQTWAADFQVTKYEMDFSFEKELDAQVSMQVSGNERGNYTFTLYRGYEITQVTDAGGNALEYDRNQDFLTVYAPEEVEEIKMKYHGFSQIFYSSSDGVMLPGYFAYYPQPGKRSVFRDFLQERVQYYGFNTQEDTLQTAEFDITCEMNGVIYSNLPGEGHRFSGTTCAPTLMGGAAAKEKRTDGTYIYPALLDLSQVSLEPLKVEMRSICEKLGMDPSYYEQIDTLIVVPATVYMDDCWGQFSVVNHCLFIGSDQINEFDPKWTANDIIRLGMHIFGDKASLQFLLFDFVSNAKYVESLEPMSEEEFFAVSYDPADPDSEAYGQFYFGGQMEQMYQGRFDFSPDPCVWYG